MIVRLVLVGAALLMLMQPAHARRVALVVGQGAYLGGATATVGLSPLDNPPNDAGKIAELLDRHGFEVLSCDGKRPGCFDLDRAGLLVAVDRLEVSAKRADMALVFFAGHGLSTDEGNVLAPIDANVDCATGAVRQGITVERFMRATEPAKHKLLILDACRDNPLGLVCPGLRSKKLSFTRIEAGAMQGFLLVTSTQFGQQALDGPPGSHSPFATALLAALEANASVYFEQVMNEVARATFEAARRRDGFLQIPGKVVGGVAPADCLAGQGCIGDSRMAALAIENERLSAAAVEARTEAQSQASQAAKHRELARIQRLLLSPGPIAEIRMGSDDAPIIMIEYCVMWAAPCYAHHKNTMPALKKKYIDTGNVLYIYRDFPDSDLGIQTHMISHCIGSDDRSRFLEALYGRKLGGPTGQIHFTAAEQLGFSREKIDSCLADRKLRSDVVSLMDGMKRLNLYAFPTFFINSEMSVGQSPLEFFETKFNEILAAGK